MIVNTVQGASDVFHGPNSTNILLCCSVLLGMVWTALQNRKTFFVVETHAIPHLYSKCDAAFGWTPQNREGAQNSACDVMTSLISEAHVFDMNSTIKASL